MRVDVLGPLRVAGRGGEVRIGGARVRALLVRLALDAGHPVGTAALTGDLWPDSEPAHPDAALHSLASRLRRLLPDPAAVRTSPGGYLLDVPADAVDALRFTRLAIGGRRALAAGDTRGAAESLAQALALWRGDPLAGADRYPFAAAAAAALESRRLDAVEDRAEADLAGGGPRWGAAAELERLAAANPVRERLRLMLVRTLAAEGRQSEALAAYEEYRTLLAETLGADPGPDLQALHLRLLRGAAEPGPAAQRGAPPAPLTALIGRDRELQQLSDRLRTHRLVTLVGAGGAGKTRIAVRAAADAERARFADLGPVADPGDVPHAVAGALGLRSSPDAADRIAEALALRPPLLVLDCCEHVLDAAAHLVQVLLERCPQLRILASSREPLSLSGEAVLPVPPLDPGSAARLFTERAQGADPAFAAEAGAVAHICRRLDGLPLALELAAARTRSMSAEMLAAGLDDRFALLGDASRGSPRRHRTLQAAVAWSWDLLSDSERGAAERAAVFPGGFAADAAERLGITRRDLLALTAKSLIDRDGDRYRMLDTVRAYGRERLSERGELQAALAEHAACYRELAERAAPHLRGAEQLGWLEVLDAERVHLVAALRFTSDAGEAEAALRLGAALGLYWAIRGEHAEAVRLLSGVLRAARGAQPAAEGLRVRAAAAYLLNAALAGTLDGAAADAAPLPEAGGPAGAFVRAVAALAAGAPGIGAAELGPHLGSPDPWTDAVLLLARSLLHDAAGRPERSRADMEQAAKGFRAAGERWGLALALTAAAADRAAAGQAGAAGALLAEAEPAARALGAAEGALVWQAMVRIDIGDTAAAQAVLEEVAATAEEARHGAAARICLADLARQAGRTAEAREHLELAPRCADQSVGALRAAAEGRLAAASRSPEAARCHFTDALARASAIADTPLLASAAVGIADLLNQQGAARSAAEVLGAADAVRGGPNPHHPDVARVAAVLLTHRAAYEQGRALAPDRALEMIRAR
ncbi:BTAD domain-containing putative transcriptional regulator [Nocardiopsis coralliicola]